MWLIIPFSVRREKHLQSLAFPALSPTLDEALHKAQSHYTGGTHPS